MECTARRFFHVRGYNPTHTVRKPISWWTPSVPDSVDLTLKYGVGADAPPPITELANKSQVLGHTPAIGAQGLAFAVYIMRSHAVAKRLRDVKVSYAGRST